MCNIVKKEKYEDGLEYESDPIATFVYYDIFEEYIHKSDFKIEYHRTDGWRGYYDIVESKGWTNVHSDCALLHSEDCSNLENFDDLLEAYCYKKEIPLVKVYTRTSNVCSVGVDYFIRIEYIEKIEKVVKTLKDIYRDPVTFFTTAFTGKNYSDLTFEDKVFTYFGLIETRGELFEERRIH